MRNSGTMHCSTSMEHAAICGCHKRALCVTVVVSSTLGLKYKCLDVVWNYVELMFCVLHVSVYVLWPLE